MSDELLSLMMLAATGATIGLSLFKIWPAIARARFTAEAAAVRDEVEDAMLRGDLPDVECVRWFIAKADTAQANAAGMSFSFVYAWHLTAAEYNQLPPNRRGTYAELNPAQRKFMHECDKKMVDALARRLIYGSSVALPLRLALAIPARSRSRKLVPRTRPRVLAREYQRAHHPPTPHHV